LEFEPLLLEAVHAIAKLLRKHPRFFKEAETLLFNLSVNPSLRLASAAGAILIEIKDQNENSNA